MTENQEAQVLNSLGEMCKEDWSYRGVPLLQAMRLRVYMLLKDKTLAGGRHRAVVAGRTWLWCVRQAAQLIWFRGERSNQHGQIVTSPTPTFVVAVDHDNDSFIELLTDVSTALGWEGVTLVSQDARLFRRLRAQGRPTLSAIELQQSVRLRWAHIRAANRVLRNGVVSRQALLVRVQAWLAAVWTTKLVDSYFALLERLSVSGVVTLCDAQNHEFVLASVANARGIPTATLQHGLLDEASVPVISRWIFAWGDSSRAELIRLGVPEEKIVVAGRPAVDAELAFSAAALEEDRREFCCSVGLNPNQPLVAYFGTNWGPELNRRLFDLYAESCDLPFSSFAKLKSNATPWQIAEYRQWAAERPSTRSLPVVTGENPWRCFRSIDVLVTCHSAAGAEALAFGVAVILVDILPEMRLSTMLPHYRDCLVVKSSAELRSLLSRICREPAYLSGLKNAARDASLRHVKTGAGWDASRFIAGVMNEAVVPPTVPTRAAAVASPQSRAS